MKFSSELMLVRFSRRLLPSRALERSLFSYFPTSGLSVETSELQVSFSESNIYRFVMFSFGGGKVKAKLPLFTLHSNPAPSNAICQRFRRFINSIGRRSLARGFADSPSMLGSQEEDCLLNNP
jgi:hypothetical protein